MILIVKKSLYILGIILLVSSVGCSASEAEISGTETMSFGDESSVKPEEASQIEIVDINFDGVPELFLLRQGVGSSSIYRGCSFKDGQLLDIKIQGGTVPSDLLLYREQETGETIWLAGGMFIYGETGRTYEYVWNQVDFSDLSNVNSSLFYGWRKTIELDGSVSRELLENGIYLTKGQEPYYENPIFSGYELVNTLTMFSYLEEFKTGNGFDRDMYNSFLDMYEETKQENRKNGEKI